jgi:CCDC81 eukaryotic HU domain 2
MANDFGKQNSLKQRSPGAPDNLPVSALNYEQLSIIAGLPRDVVEKIVTKFLYVLGRAVREGRKISLLIHRITSVLIENGELKCEFMTEYLNDFKAPTVATRGLVQAPLAPGRSSKSVSSRTLRNTSTNTVIKPNPDVPRGSRSSSTHRGERSMGSERGAGYPGDRTGGKQSAAAVAQRPHSSQSMRSNSSVGTSGTRASADTMSLMHSPRAAVGGQSRTGGGLRKENLDMLQAQSQSRGTGTLNGGTGKENFHRGVPKNLEGARHHWS